jgi:hypothetical protein
VAGTATVDGFEQKFSGELPTHIAVEARSFEYTNRMPEPVGELITQLAVGDNVYGSSNTANDFTGVHGVCNYLDKSRRWHNHGLERKINPLPVQDGFRTFAREREIVKH